MTGPLNARDIETGAIKEMDCTETSPGSGIWIPRVAAEPITQANDTTVSGPAALSAINIDLLTGTVNGWYDAGAFQSGSIQVIATAGISAGAIIFEQTNDTVVAAAGVPLRAYEASLINANPNVAAITIAASTARIFTIPINARFVRVRISTAFTGGTVRAVASFSQRAASFPVLNIQQAVAANLLMTATVAGGPTAEDTANSASPIVVGGIVRTARAPATLVAGDGVRATYTPEAAQTVASGASTYQLDVASAARTTSGNSGAISTCVGGGLSGKVIVSAVSGTNPTMDLTIEESYDNGTTWDRVYTFERLTAARSTFIPPMLVSGLRRYVWVLGGTSPSFTFAIHSNTFTANAPIVRSLIDRAIAPNTALSNSASIYIEGTRTVALRVVSGAGATANPVYGIHLSEDESNWADSGMSLTAPPSQTVSAHVEVAGKFARIYIKTAGTGAVQTYAALRAVG